METVVLRVNGMSCDHCSNAVKNGIKELNGIQDVSVDLASKQVSIDFDPSVVNKDAFVSAITEAGYEVV